MNTIGVQDQLNFNGLTVLYQVAHLLASGKKLEEIFLGFTPEVELASLDDAYLNMKGTIKHYGSYSNAAVLIKNRIKEELNITASIGIGTSKLVARTASGIYKPDGLVELGEVGCFRFIDRGVRRKVLSWEGR